MGAKTGDIVPGAACELKYSCVPFGKGCSGEYCRECRRQNYLYYFNKKWDKEGRVKRPQAFSEMPHHEPVRCSSGMRFGW